MSSANGAGANSQAEGRGANISGANSQAEGRQTLTPALGAPAADPRSNSQAEGSVDPQAPAPHDDENAPVARARYNEVVRQEAALRKERTEMRARLQALEDAKLTEQERDKKRATDLETQYTEQIRANQGLRLQIAIADRVRERDLADGTVVKAILLTEYREQLDDDPNLENVAHLIDLAVEKYPFLVKQSPQSPVPGSGRQVSPPRTPAGQYAARQNAQPQEPKPFNQFPNWSQLTDADWDTESRRRERGQ